MDTHNTLLPLVQAGPPGVIGMGDITQAAYAQGWNNAMTRVYEGCIAAGLIRHAGVPATGPITLAFELADQQCYDIMCTATEGGINYWADIIKRKGKLRDDSEIPDIVSFEADVQDGPVSCDHPEIEAQEIGRFTIGPDMIRAGLRRLLAPGAEISPAIRNDAVLQLVDPEHASDADTADAIVQFAVFGELVFS